MTGPDQLPNCRRRRSGPGADAAVDRILAAWTCGVFAFLYLPIGVLVAYSFNASRLNVLWGGFTLGWYAEMWRNEALMESVRNSLIVAAVATLASTVLGTAGAWVLHRSRSRLAGLVRALVGLPIVMPEVVMGVGLLVLFTAAGFELGFATVILAHITFCFPFVLVGVLARLQGLDPSLEEAALDLGATPMKAFLLVVVPLLRPAIAAGALLAFTLSLDELVVTYFTAGPASATLPLRVYGMARVGMNPTLNAVSTLFILATAACVLGAERAKARGRRPPAPTQTHAS